MAAAAEGRFEGASVGKGISIVHKHKNADLFPGGHPKASDRLIAENRLRNMRAHPRIMDASRRLATSFVQRYDGNRIANRVLNDRARALFAIMVLYLDSNPDASGTRLTAGRIIGLCQETGLCSRGRAKAMLLLMRWAGYLAPVTEAGPDADRRQRPLAVTPALSADYIARWTDVYSALALVDPIAEKAMAHIGEPAFRAGVSRAIISRFRGGWRLLDFAPALELFSARDCGFLMLLALALSAPDDEPFPPSCPLKIPVAALGRRFHVSRAHVLKMLRDAETEGLLRRVSDTDGATVELLEPVREGIISFYCGVFIMFGDAARETFAAKPYSD